MFLILHIERKTPEERKNEATDRSRKAPGIPHERRNSPSGSGGAARSPARRGSGAGHPRSACTRGDRPGWTPLAPKAIDSETFFTLYVLYSSKYLFEISQQFRV